MTIDEFERVMAVAIRALPAFFKERMINVVVIVRARPAAAQAKKFSRGLLGLYEGVPLLDRGHFYSGAMPDKITIFQKNIETRCSGPEEIEKEVRHVVMHEIAHHFGITDEELRAKGLY